MPFVHICPKHGREPCPAILPHACREDASLVFDSPTIPVDIPMEVG